VHVRVLSSWSKSTSLFYFICSTNNKRMASDWE